MSVPEDMIAIAEDIIRQWGVPAKYRAQGAAEAVDVMIRKKPKRKVTTEGRAMMQMEISVLSSVVTIPAFRDVVEVDGEEWTLSPLPMEFYEIQEACGGALWNLTLVREVTPTMRGGAA